MAWGIEQLGQRRNVAVEFDPEKWMKLGNELRKRKYDKEISDTMAQFKGGNEEDNESQLRAMAQKYAAYDPERSQQWMSAADQIRERIEARKQRESEFGRQLGQQKELADLKIEGRANELAELKEQQRAALDAVNTATVEWQKDPENYELQNKLREAINNAKLLKLTPENPIDDYMRSKGIDASIGLRGASLEIAKQEATSRQAEREERRKDVKESKDIDLEKRAEKVMPIYGAYNRLKTNPNDITTRNDAMNRLLRDESGAAIGKDEVLNRLATVLDPADYKEMVSELGGLKGWVAGTTGNENLLMIQSMEKYLGKMKTDRMLNILRDRIGSERVFNYLEQSKPTQQPQKPAASQSKMNEWIMRQKVK